MFEYCILIRTEIHHVGGYLNESGVIDTVRLQVVLDEMKLWEMEIFEKEYADLNWYKGKQAKHVEAMEQARKRSQLGSSYISVFSCLIEKGFV